MAIRSLLRSQITNAEWYDSFLAGNSPALPSDYDLLETTILGSDTSSVDFTGLGSYSNYKHLQIRVAARTDRATNFDFMEINFNGETAGANYYYHNLYGNGSSVVSGGAADSYEVGIIGAANSGTDIFGAAVIDILDFASTSKNTTVRSLSGVTGTSNYVQLGSVLWDSTSALTSITLDKIGSNFVTGSRFSLYGIRAA